MTTYTSKFGSEIKRSTMQEMMERGIRPPECRKKKINETKEERIIYKYGMTKEEYDKYENDLYS